MCRSVILLQFFAQKQFRQQTFLQNLQIFDRIYRSTDFLETFQTIVGNKTPKQCRIIANAETDKLYFLNTCSKLLNRKRLMFNKRTADGID